MAAKQSKTDAAKQLADRIKANVSDWYDHDRIGFEEFNERAKALWDEAYANGTADEVTEILAPSNKL